MANALKKVVLSTPLGPPLRTAYRKLLGKPNETEPPSEVYQLLDQHIAQLEKTNPHAHLHRYHLKRYAKSLEMLPDAAGRLLDLGGYKGLFRTLLEKYRRYELFFADSAHPDPKFRCNVEKDKFPFEDSSCDVVLFMEVLEHLSEDPMHALSEINRVLRPGGILLLSTPNLCSWKAIRRALNHEHSGLFPPYLRAGGTDRHNREYTAKEIRQLVDDAGFEIVQFETCDVYDHSPGNSPIPGFDPSDRGDTTFCLCKKVGPVRVRMPSWLYWPN